MNPIGFFDINPAEYLLQQTDHAKGPSAAPLKARLMRVLRTQMGVARRVVVEQEPIWPNLANYPYGPAQR